MKYGKIRIEDGNFIFSKHMMMNYLPCKISSGHTNEKKA